MKQAGKLLIRGAALVLAVCLLWCLAVWRSGEMADDADILRRQLEDSRVLYGPYYRENYSYYRAEGTRLVSPEVLVLGDSRASHIRSFFFNEPEKVYNACWGALTPSDVTYFLQNQPNNSIKTVIFVLSHFDFNENYREVELELDHDNYVNDKYGQGMNFASASSAILGDWKAGTYSLWPIWTASGNTIGIGAALAHNGMMSDGSFFSGGEYKARAENPDPTAHLQSTVDRIQNEGYRFEYGSEVNPDTVQALRDMLAYCREHDIEVVSYLPSYAPSINELMAQTCDEDGNPQYGYQYQLVDIVAPIFEEYGFEFYDYTDPTVLGCDDDYFLDGYHGSDVVMERMLRDMVEQGSVLGQYCDTTYLRALDDARHSNYMLLENLQAYQAQMPAYRVQG